MQSDGGQETHKSTTSTSGSVYRIVVDGELSERYAAAFEGMEMERRGGQTVLMGEDIDQPRLHGILQRINALGLRLARVESSPGVER
jgi:hypothetical protein